MPKRKMAWVYTPSKQPKPKVPESIKTEVEKKANELVESTLKPQHIKSPPPNTDFNYIVDIYTNWYRSYFYFCAKYCCPSPNAIALDFEVKFARMEYVGDNKFNLAYMRHTEQWWELYQGLSLDQCLATIKDDPNFMP